MQAVKQEQCIVEAPRNQEVQSKNFSNHFPAVEISSKHYSLDADIATGWKPKVKILGPIPLNFDSRITDSIVDELTSFGRKYKQRVIYLGYRHQSSFKMHQQIKRNYDFKYEGVVNSNYLHMAAYFRKFHANFKSKTTRIFKGMNPTISKDEELIFDSNFQSGNLDAVVRTNENQYDLFMRVDSNTKGHLQWFNFTVKNCGKKRVKFNIVNFKKAKTMYTRGMKPYMFSIHLQQTKQLGWFQAGQNVKYRRKKLNYEFLQYDFTQQQMTYNCLSFEYQFNTDWQTVQFAYAPPFTYSDNIEMLKSLRLQSRNIMKQQQINENILKEQVLCESLSGLQLPLLTITNPSIDDKKKRCILISARIHPGQSCGSYMMKGFLQYICSSCEQAKYLRENIVFKVIPMLNPDGVTLGNFRTSLCGKDLNRTFKITNDLLIPQVKNLKDLVSKLKRQWRNRLIMFFDFHGHSIKKNVFLYGPQYQIWQTGYYRTRIFPKLLADKTQIFRYYSCLFRIAEFKRTTARAVLLRNIPHCYTVEASTGFYYSTEEKRDIPFTIQKYQFMGQKIAVTLKDYIDLIYDQEISRQERKQKLSQMRVMKSNRVKSKRQHQRSIKNKYKPNNNNNTKKSPNNNQQKSQNIEKAPKNLQNQRISQQNRNQNYGYISEKARLLIQKIRKDEEEETLKKDLHQGHESDNFSEGGSDSQSQSDDLNQQELNKFHKDIVDSLRQFRQKLGGSSDFMNLRQFSLKQEPKKRNTIKAKPKNIEVIASLRHKVQKLQKAKERGTMTSLKPVRDDVKLQKIKRNSAKLSNPHSKHGPFLLKPYTKSAIGQLEQNKGYHTTPLQQNDYQVQQDEQIYSYDSSILRKNPGVEFNPNAQEMHENSSKLSLKEYRPSKNNEKNSTIKQLNSASIPRNNKKGQKSDSITKTRLYSLIERNNIPREEEKFIPYSQKNIIEEYFSTHEQKSGKQSSPIRQQVLSKIFQEAKIKNEGLHSQIIMKYTSQLQGEKRNLASKLKKIFEQNSQNMDLLYDENLLSFETQLLKK